jgi:hypothetical protein
MATPGSDVDDVTKEYIKRQEQREAAQDAKMEVMTGVKTEIETLIKWFNKQVTNNLKLHSTLLVTRRPDPEKKVREKVFTSPLKICRCK